MILCHSHLGFKNGLIIHNPNGTENDPYYKIGRSQYAISVQPNTKLGVFTKPFSGFGRVGQAHTPYVVDVSKYDSNIFNYYTSHYNRYQLKTHNVPQLGENMGEDVLNMEFQPNDELIEVEDESTAPAVKSGFRGGKQDV